MRLPSLFWVYHLSITLHLGLMTQCFWPSLRWILLVPSDSVVWTDPSRINELQRLSWEQCPVTPGWGTEQSFTSQDVLFLSGMCHYMPITVSCPQRYLAAIGRDIVGQIIWGVKVDVESDQLIHTQAPLQLSLMTSTKVFQVSKHTFFIPIKYLLLAHRTMCQGDAL